MSLASLIGIKTLEVRKSKVNGEIEVFKDLAFGTSIKVSRLTQSGGIVESIWKKTLRKVEKRWLTINSCLVLGLGGGSTAKIVRKLWPAALIVGVDIDPVMIELGKKYLKLNDYDVKIKIADAYDFCLKSNKDRFDLVLVDLYLGDQFPKKFTSNSFLVRIKQMLGKKGVVVFNWLYYGSKRTEAVKFGKKLEKYFNSVDYVYPEANLMFICCN